LRHFSVAGVDTYHLTTGGSSSTTLTVRFNAPHQDAGIPAVQVTAAWRK